MALPNRLIVGKLVAGVPTGRTPRTSLTIQRAQRRLADHLHMPGVCGWARRDFRLSVLSLTPKPSNSRVGVVEHRNQVRKRLLVDVMIEVRRPSAGSTFRSASARRVRGATGPSTRSPIERGNGTASRRDCGYQNNYAIASSPSLPFRVSRSTPCNTNRRTVKRPAALTPVCSDPLGKVTTPGRTSPEPDNDHSVARREPMTVRCGSTQVQGPAHCLARQRARYASAREKIPTTVTR